MKSTRRRRRGRRRRRQHSPYRPRHPLGSFPLRRRPISPPFRRHADPTLSRRSDACHVTVGSSQDFCNRRRAGDGGAYGDEWGGVGVPSIGSIHSRQMWGPTPPPDALLHLSGGGPSAHPWSDAPSGPVHATRRPPRRPPIGLLAPPPSFPLPTPLGGGGGGAILRGVGSEVAGVGARARPASGQVSVGCRVT